MFFHVFEEKPVSELKNPVVWLWTSSDLVAETVFIVDMICTKINIVNSIPLSLLFNKCIFRKKIPIGII